MVALAVEFGVLGAVEAHVDGRPVPLGHARQQSVLAALLIDVNQLVPAERLAGRVWGQDLPQRARNTLQSYLSRLRQILADAGAAGITRQQDSYVLTVDPSSVDLHRFGQLLAQARASRDDEQAHDLFGRALALWRGDAFAALDTAWLSAVRESLHQQRFAAELDHADVRLRLGQHAALLAELDARAGAHPLDERVSGQLMLALYRCGRTGDALARYQVSRRQLAEELGIDPGPELQRLHQQILAGNVPGDGPAVPVRPAAKAGPAGPAVPRQLPAPPPLFTGRAGELSQLTAALPTSGDLGRDMVIWVIDGTGGVGKTWLALRWAHDHAQSFPDGQLYVNLRGFGSAGSAADPAEAVRGFLDALGVPAERIPADLAAQAGLYRSLLAGKRVLVVLDNAHDVRQVRPLLPGSPGCQVLVTSRSRLTGLVTAEGARPLSLDLLTSGEARDLLAARLGSGRVAAESAAASEIITRCARLPLALAIAAARAAARPAFPLASLAAELRDAAGGLDAFAASDAAIDVRTMFSWSYHALSTDAARLFRLLGLHPGPDIALPATASLVGLPSRQARALLAELTRAHLLTEHVPGRYAFHDLLRAYATEQARTHDDGQARQSAMHRILDHYLHTGRLAARLLDPYLDSITVIPIPPVPGVTLAEPATAEDALDWFTTEHAGLLAAIQLAAGAGFDTHAWQLAWSPTTFFLRRGHWHDQALAQNVGLDAARRTGSKVGQAHALHGLALGYARSGRFDEAQPHFQHALRLFEQAGDHASQAYIHGSFTWLSERQERPADALSHSLRALELWRAAGHRAGQAMGLGDVGYCHALLGNYQQALTYCGQALTTSRELGEPDLEAANWHSLGYTHHQLGNYRQSVICYQHSLGLCRDLADRYNEADTLAHLGDAHHGAGDPGAARRAWRLALDILGQLDHPDADQVRAKLDSLELTADSAAPGPAVVPSPA